MRFEEQSIRGVYLIHPDRIEDDRGFFARTYSRTIFLEVGLTPCDLECSISHNAHRGTLRGLHYQSSPHGETKLVRCTQGDIWDVVVDLRPESQTFGQSWSVELSAKNGLSIYIPNGVAHGFLTQTPESEVFYQIANPYVPSAATGVRWDDPVLNIPWPFDPLVISDRDRNLPLWNERVQ